MRRIRQVGWMVDHLADLESDFSAVHRIDDMFALDGPKFFRLAWRISAYKGVMRMRIEAQQHEDESTTPQAAPSAPSAPRGGPVGRPARNGPGVPPMPPGVDRVVPLSVLMFEEGSGELVMCGV